MTNANAHIVLEELMIRATYRRSVSGSLVGAALGRELTEPGLDGRRWECLITDTINGYREIEVLAPRVEHDAEIEPEQVEAKVEQKAYAFPLETRLDDLQERSPIRVELYLETD